MTHSMVSGHISWVLAVAVVLAAAGILFYFLRKNFQEGLKGLPRRKAPVKSPPELSHEVSRDESRAEPSVPQEVAAVATTVSDGGETDTQRYIAASIHVAIWTYDRVLEGLQATSALEALNEFHAAGAAWAVSLAGVYERSSGASFFIHWTEGTGASSALKCALELRQEFIRWNETRKTDGHLPLMIVIGADVGPALCGQVGPQSQRQDCIIGEVVARARALSQIAVSLGTDVLVTEEIWLKVPGQYLGERVAEAHLTALGNLTSCYRLKGYFGEQGQEVWVKGPELAIEPMSRQVDAPRVETSNEPAQWRVNNGSQILGPMTTKDIARALYSLDLDFDCECWEEGRGNRMTIEKSEMFGSHEEPDACFWVFDGDTLHGPLTEGFLKTGVGRQVFPRDSFVCERSTLNGWRPLMELRAAWKEKAAADAVNEALKSEPTCLAPIAELVQQAMDTSVSLTQESAPEPMLDSSSTAVAEEPTFSTVLEENSSPDIAVSSLIENSSASVEEASVAEIPSQAAPLRAPIIIVPALSAKPQQDNQPEKAESANEPEKPQSFESPTVEETTADVGILLPVLEVKKSA